MRTEERARYVRAGHDDRRQRQIEAIGDEVADRRQIGGDIHQSLAAAEACKKSKPKKRMNRKIRETSCARPEKPVVKTDHGTEQDCVDKPATTAVLRLVDSTEILAPNV